MKKLWETKVFESKDRESRTGRALEIFSRNFLTILLGAFLLMILGILIVILYTSNGGGDKEKSNQAFFDPNNPSTSVVSSQSAVDSEEEDSVAESSTTTPSTATLSSAQAARLSQEAENPTRPTQVVSQGGTDSVQAGEGAAAIAARNGISIEELYALNPDKMTGPGGTWWANPGDIVIVN